MLLWFEEHERRRTSFVESLSGMDRALLPRQCRCWGLRRREKVRLEARSKGLACGVCFCFSGVPRSGGREVLLATRSRWWVAMETCFLFGRAYASVLSSRVVFCLVIICSLFCLRSRPWLLLWRAYSRTYNTYDVRFHKSAFEDRLVLLIQGCFVFRLVSRLFGACLWPSTVSRKMSQRGRC